MDFDKQINEIPRADIHRFALGLADMLYMNFICRFPVTYYTVSSLLSLTILLSAQFIASRLDNTFLHLPSSHRLQFPITDTFLLGGPNAYRESLLCVWTRSNSNFTTPALPRPFPVCSQPHATEA